MTVTGEAIDKCSRWQRGEHPHAVHCLPSKHQHRDAVKVLSLLSPIGLFTVWQMTRHMTHDDYCGTIMIDYRWIRGWFPALASGLTRPRVRLTYTLDSPDIVWLKCHKPATRVLSQLLSTPRNSSVSLQWFVLGMFSGELVHHWHQQGSLWF